ncbi:MAG: type II toxin-antitoxin system PemK/MazF family toxin [Rhodocyclaceae bacterium]|nr:type II toxin-antitoxin system PemK/MazF family toxin [Rhodocyclaceae bacterium]MBK6909067.1 type II toxin-antitoxin system PemK/MazF family toxin [Rhodocyclaceae bacterium]
MKRGDLVTVVIQGDIGKPRPALVIQADAFSEHPSVTIIPTTGTLVDAPLMRVPVQPDPTNGLREETHIMIDKIVTIRREKIGVVFGQLDKETLAQVDRLLAVFLGIV